MTVLPQRKTLLLAATLFLTGMLFGMGIIIAQASLSHDGRDNAKRNQLIPSIIDQINLYYINELKENELADVAIKGIFENLDPHSRFLNEQEMSVLFDFTTGEYTGIGIEVEEKNNTFVVIETLQDSPAAKVGLQKGDIIRSIGNTSVANMSFDDVSDLIRGREGEPVFLDVERGGEHELHSFEIIREKLSIASVKSKMLKGDIGYIRITSFQEKTAQEVFDAVMELSDDNTQDLKGLVIDLRDNPGGVMDASVNIADLFLDHGLIVSTYGRFREANLDYYATPEALVERTPIAILINERSASASEILAGALKAHQRATVVGIKSYGKGSVQSLIPLSGGKTAMKLTTSLYRTPDGVSIDKIGVEPDIEITQNISPEHNKTSGPLTNMKVSKGQYLAANDRQLLKAIEILQTEQADPGQH